MRLFIFDQLDLSGPLAGKDRLTVGPHLQIIVPPRRFKATADDRITIACQNPVP